MRLKEYMTEITKNEYITYRNTYNEMAKINKMFNLFVTNINNTNILPEKHKKLFNIVNKILNGKGHPKTTINLQPFKLPALSQLNVEKE